MPERNVLPHQREEEREVDWCEEIPDEVQRNRQKEGEEELDKPSNNRDLKNTTHDELLIE
jgi:hypothetical protein